MGCEYEIVIGLEVHAELATDSKIFCGCPTAFGASPNTQICPVCLGLPGSLPVLNKSVLFLALRAALALDCEINGHTKFDRKNYFYPDLPKGYQISQYDLPLAKKGRLLIDTPANEKVIGITRVHLEEDAGKLVHLSQGGQINNAAGSLVDYNRAGVPLIEIVSEPELRSPEEAYAYLLALKEILLYTEVSDCNMEEGSLRCDANISLRPPGQRELGVKAEVKNMNSFKHVREALEYEVKRQQRILAGGGKVEQETRLWDAERNVTHSMRGKEEAHDYRYFPEPDLPPMVISPEMKNSEKDNLPKELPRQKRRRYQEKLGLNKHDVEVITASPNLAKMFESAISHSSGQEVGITVLAKTACNLLTTEYLGRLNAEGKDIETFEPKLWPISSQHFGELATATASGELSSKLTKQIFQEMWNTNKSKDEVIKEKGWAQISDKGEITKLVDQVLTAHPGPVAEYRAGKTQTLGFLVGQVMKSSQGQADPKLVNQILREKLEKRL